VVDRGLLLYFEVPLLTASDVVRIVDETVLELTRSRLSCFGHLLLTLGEGLLHLGLARLLLLNAVEVVLLHGFQLHLVLVTLGSLTRSATHLVEGVNVPLRVFQELVNVLTEHLFKVAILHTYLAGLPLLLPSDVGYLLLLVVRVVYIPPVGLVSSLGTTSRHSVIDAIVDGALTVLVKSTNLVSKGSQLAKTRLSELLRDRYCSVLGDVTRNDTISIVLNTWAGFLHMSVSSIDSSHLEVTVGGLKELVKVLLLLLRLPLFLFTDLA